MHVTDPTDPRLDEYRFVRDRDLLGRDGHPGRFIGETALVVEKMLERPGCTRSVLCADRMTERVAAMIAAGADARAGRTVPLFSCPDDIVESITGFHIHRGILAVGTRPPRDVDLSELLPVAPAPATVLAIDGINNIDNVGMLFRNAAAFGVDGVLLSHDAHDPLYRKSLRVSIGHALSIPFRHCTDEADWLGSLEALGTRHGCTRIGLAIDDDRTRLDAITPPRRVVVVVGNEFEGLRPSTRAACDALARIPMAAGIDSLNVGVAAAVALDRLSRGARV